MACCMCLRYRWEDPQEVFAEDDDGKKYCLFHAPASLKDGHHKELMEAVEKRISDVTKHNEASDVKNHKVCMLNGTVFAEDVSFAFHNLPNISFANVTFCKEAGFQYTTFCGETNFDHTSFNGFTDFWSSTFENKVSFCSVTFNEEIIFIYVTCNDDISFLYAKFKGDINFLNTTFENEAKFTGTTFTNKADFLNVTFNGDTTFKSSKFNAEANFSNASFGGKSKKSKTDFSSTKVPSTASLNLPECTLTGPFIVKNAEFEGKICFDRTDFDDKVIFSEGNLGQASFQLCTFATPPLFDRVDLRNTELIGAPVDTFRLLACKWPESKGRRVTYDGRKVEGEGFFALDNVKHIAPYRQNTETQEPVVPSLNDLEDLYRRLKKTARAEMDETLASDFHYAEKEVRRKLEKERFYDSRSSRHDPKHPLLLRERWRGGGACFALICYKLCSEYGEGPRRAGLILLGIILLPLILLEYVGLYSFFTYQKAGSAFYSTLSNSYEMWLHFLPLVKLPNSEEAGWGLRICMLLWQLCITLQATLFGFALRNRFRR